PGGSHQLRQRSRRGALRPGPPAPAVGRESRDEPDPLRLAQRSPPPDRRPGRRGSRDSVKRGVIVGGGISGLAAAHYLRRARSDLSIPLLEARERLGGVITTLRRDGFVMEGGPDSFITLKPWALQLCHDLGIEKRLIPPDPANRKVYVYSRGRLRELPPGLMMGAPTRIAPFLKTRLISWPGKLRMAM